MGANVALPTDRHVAQRYPALGNPITQQLRIGADACAIANGDQIEGNAQRRSDSAIAPDFGAHRTIIKAHERRTYEHLRPAQHLESADEPPAKIVKTPYSIPPRPIAADYDPFQRDTQKQEGRPNQEADNRCDECGLGIRNLAVEILEDHDDRK